MTGDAADSNLSACCILHEVYKVASKCPDKIAVIHASGFARTTGDLLEADRHQCSSCTKLAASSSRPTVYEGDECFTFSVILSAVEKLSSRLWRILHGADVSCIFKADSVDNLRDNSEHISKLQYSSQSIHHSSKFKKSHIPKVIGIYMEPSVEYIVAVLSVLRCGESFLPLDPSWPKARILSVISSSKAELVVGIDSSPEVNWCHKIDNLKWLVDEGICHVLQISMKETIKEKCQPVLLAWPCETESSRSFCYLMYTSGSSGKPKGVCGTEIGLLNRFSWMQQMYPLHEGDVVIFKTAISFIDHIQEFLGALLSTCTLVIPPFNQLKENVCRVVDYLQGYFVNRLVAVPSLMRAILPFLQSQHSITVQGSLKLLILSGEVLHLPLCKMLLELLPQTSILNLYGSTEVTGDCTYFDCTRLPQILEKEVLSSIPIGLPVSNCDVLLVGDVATHEGEIYVSGLCVAAGYFDYPHLIPLSDEDVSPEHDIPNNGCGFQRYFRTGDFARKLPSGDLVFLGRKDRTVKVNGQRVALEEIEGAFREHPDVVNSAVLSHEVGGGILFIEAHVVREETSRDEELLKSSLKNWVLKKLPHVMVPSRIFFTKSLPLTPSGKVDYLLLTSSRQLGEEKGINIGDIRQDHLLEVIKKVFSEALMVEKVSPDDDFFEMGGNSLSAAYVSFKLGIHMKLVYTFPTPSRLQTALWSSGSSIGIDAFGGVDLRKSDMPPSRESKIPNLHESKLQGILSEANSNRDDHMDKKLKTEPNTSADPSKEPSRGGILWNPNVLHRECSFSRCNKSRHLGKCDRSYSCEIAGSNILPGDGKGFLQELWKIDLGSCIDASPLVVCKGSDIYVFIGSHSHKFVCIDGRSGFVQWESKLEGRVECSATILDDFSQVVIGCYKGNIYFLQFSNGSISWRFQTNGEVKSQPVVDKCRHLVWCGSYDHNLYAIDYKSYCCIYKLQCGGSIFGSPAINDMQNLLYVASTNGHVTALEIKALPFKTLWKQDMGAPIFGSLSINYPDGNIICCLVDGTVIVLSNRGSNIWKVRTGGPIFAGPCTAGALPSQVLICSRDGNVYSFEMATGNLIWKHTVGHPITSSAYIEEVSHFKSDTNPISSGRLICVCDSSGSVHVLRVNPHAVGGVNPNTDELVREFARLDLNGDIFSSPVMVGGRIFVGCRDNHVHCIQLGVQMP